MKARTRVAKKKSASALPRGGEKKTFKLSAGKSQAPRSGKQNGSKVSGAKPASFIGAGAVIVTAGGAKVAPPRGATPSGGGANKRLPESGRAKVGKPSTRGGGASKLPNIGKADLLDIRSEMAISQDELARMTGYSLRSIAGWESGKALSLSARQKMTETLRLRDALSQIVPSGELGKWLHSPNPAFEGQPPIQIIERGESDRIWRMIVQIDAGIAN